MPQRLTSFVCPKTGHRWNVWLDLADRPDFLRCKKCRVKAARVDDGPVKTAVETTGFVPEILFEHRNYGLVPHVERLKKQLEREGIVRRDEAGMPYVHVESREALRKICDRLGVALLSGEGKVDERKQLGMTEEQYERLLERRKHPQDKACEGQPGPSMAKRLERDRKFREAWDEKRMRGGKVNWV